MMYPMSRIAASCLFILLLVYLTWTTSIFRSSSHIHAPTSSTQQAILRRILAEEHHFIPAVHQNLRYVGRWVPSSNRLQWDSTFPGAYLDFTVKDSSIVYVVLKNAPQRSSQINDADANVGRITFTPLKDREDAAGPVIMTVRVCNTSILHVKNSQNGLIAINLNISGEDSECAVRISHVGGFAQEAGTLQFQGLWLTKGASLQPQAQLDDPESLISEDTKHAGARPIKRPGKTVELLTDSSGEAHEGSANDTVQWLSQLAARFDVDYVKIPAHRYCLTEACTLWGPQDASTQDLFFRSGPANTSLFRKLWHFQQYVPDVLLLDLGSTEQRYFMQASMNSRGVGNELPGGRQTFESLTHSFINAYVELIRQIRRSAYPLHPSALAQYSLDGDGYTYNSAPSTLPIFVLRPFDGALARASLSVVEQLQKEGDRSVFWIDTRGWVSDGDWIFEKEDCMGRKLKPAGHAKVASFMSAHLCYYLAPEPDRCPFLRRDSYMGSVYVPIQAELDKVIEESKIKKLTELFWPRS